MSPFFSHEYGSAIVTTRFMIDTIWLSRLGRYVFFFLILFVLRYRVCSWQVLNEISLVDYSLAGFMKRIMSNFFTTENAMDREELMDLDVSVCWWLIMWQMHIRWEILSNLYQNYIFFAYFIENAVFNRKYYVGTT